VLAAIREIAGTITICVAMQKGGTGKTTSTVNLAAALRQQGLRTMVIDMDQQANATEALGVADPRLTVFEVIHKEPAVRCSLMDAAVETESGVLVVAGTDALIGVEQGEDDPGREYRLRKAIAKLPQPHVVLIDCPPNLGRCTVMSLIAADVCIAPVKPGVFEVGALARLEDTIEKIQVNEVNEDLVLGGVLAVEFDARTQLHKDVRTMLRNRFGDRYMGEVSETVRVGESAAKGRPVVLDAPGSTAAQDYTAMAKALAERIMG
jgi:chromosome partitioning protein